MKVVILAGGFGTRLAEVTEVTPKPMVPIGGRPIVWHIMKHYAAHGFGEFVLALGYKGETIKRYFIDYAHLNGRMTLCMRTGRVVQHEPHHENWTIDLVETGLHTATGGRLLRLAAILRSGTFMLTYGDGLGNVDLARLLAFHRSHGRLATLTAVRPPARFGGVEFEGDRVKRFIEKPQIGEGWINGGFFVLEPEVLDYVSGDDTAFEHAPLERLARDGELMAYRHEAFWQCMDTLRDVRLLESLWSTGRAPWVTWEQPEDRTCACSSPAMPGTSAV
jgi:glucose-1-phosphate cytidylyltransferase